MLPTSAAKYELKEEKEKKAEYENKVLNQEESLLRIEAFYGKGESQNVKEQKFQEKTSQPSLSEEEQGISISGLNPDQITQPKQLTQRQIERHRLSSAKAILEHERIEVGRGSAKKEMTPRRPDRPAQPLNKIGVDYKQLYHRAVGQLGILDVEFKSKSDDLARQVLESHNKGGNVSKEEQELISTAPIVELETEEPYAEDIQSEEQPNVKMTSCDCDAAIEDDKMSPVMEASPAPQPEPEVVRVAVNHAIEQASERIQTATGAIQTAQTDSVLSEVETGLIVNNLLRQLKDGQATREQRRLELIEQVMNEDGDDDVTAAEILKEMCNE